MMHFCALYAYSTHKGEDSRLIFEESASDTLLSHRKILYKRKITNFYMRKHHGKRRSTSHSNFLERSSRLSEFHFRLACFLLYLVKRCQCHSLLSVFGMKYTRRRPFLLLSLFLMARLAFHVRRRGRHGQTHSRNPKKQKRNLGIFSI